MATRAVPRTTDGTSRRVEARSLLVLAFAAVEVDRLLGALARLTGGPFGPLHPQFAMAGWLTAFDLTGVAIALAAVVYALAHFRGVGWATPTATIVLTAAAQHTALALLSLVFGGAGETNPVIVFAYVATSVPILVLAALHYGDMVTAARRRDGTRVQPARRD